jgi:hypothetical protein
MQSSKPMTTTTEDELRVWNKGKLIGQKPPLSPSSLGHTNATAAAEATARSCALQPRDRQ